LVALAGLALFYLWRTPRPNDQKRWGWLLLGLAVGLVTSLAWVLARAVTVNYPYGTSGVPSSVIQALANNNNGGASLWIPVALASVVPGAFLAAWLSGTLWVRGETGRRYVGLALGGGLMGIGAGIAGGCNLGHSLIGVPLLSLGSIVTTLAMGVGVLISDRTIRYYQLARG